MAAIKHYRNEMMEHLPESDDNRLLKYHKRTVERVMENVDAVKLVKEAFNTLRLDKKEQHTVTSIKEKIGKAFIDIIDQNWKKCVDICRKKLERVKTETESRNEEDYWSLVKRLNKEYNADIGESLSSKMAFLRLEYLAGRQDKDFDILMEEIQKQAIESVESVANAAVESHGVTAGTDCDVGADATRDASTSSDAAEVSDDCVLLSSEDETTQTESLINESRASEEHLAKVIKLKMTWARAVIFWKYWIDCRKETIDCLFNILDILKGELATARSTSHRPRDYMNPAQVLWKRIVSHNEFEYHQLQYAYTVNKDFLCYEVLLRKLKEFLELVKSSEYVGAFGVEPKDLFNNISTFQTNISATKSESCCGFEMCDRIISQAQGLGETTTCASRLLLHLKDLLRKLSDEGKLNEVGIEGVISDRQQEESDMSTVFSETLLSFKEAFTKVNNATEQLREAIKEWLPRRENSITKLKKIIENMNKTTKDVAITQTVSSSVGIVGGVVAIVGLILAPFTFGASLIPSVIAGGVVSGLAATTAIGAAVTEIVFDKGDMEKAKACIDEDERLFRKVANQLENSNRNFKMLLRYVPEDELETFIAVMTDPQSTAIRRNPSPFEIDPLIAVNALRFVSFAGKAVLMPITRMVYSGTIIASKAAFIALSQSVVFIGVGLDIANLVLASVKLGKGAKSENAEKLEDVIKQMEEEKDIMKNYLDKMS